MLMALTIGTTVASIQALALVSGFNSDLETSMARLSTGKRINSAADAGMAIASQLNAEIWGTDHAVGNVIDGQALIDTSEGDHANLKSEMVALTFEIDWITSATTWARQSLMASTGSAFLFPKGTATGWKSKILLRYHYWQTQHWG